MNSMDWRLISELYSNEVISHGDKTNIEAESNLIKRNELLLGLMRNASRMQFQKFCDAFVHAGQNRVANILLDRQEGTF